MSFPCLRAYNNNPHSEVNCPRPRDDTPPLPPGIGEYPWDGVLSIYNEH